MNSTLTFNQHLLTPSIKSLEIIEIKSTMDITISTVYCFLLPSPYSYMYTQLSTLTLTLLCKAINQDNFHHFMTITLLACGCYQYGITNGVQARMNFNIEGGVLCEWGGIQQWWGGQQSGMGGGGDVGIRGTFLLCRCSITLQELDKADTLLMEFCEMFVLLYMYCKENCTINMHLHGHLKECVLDFRTVYSFWLFSFEWMNGILGACYTNLLWYSIASDEMIFG